MATAAGKIEERKREERRRHKLCRAARKRGDDTQQLARASAKPKKATGVPGTLKKVAGGDSYPLVLFQLITELPLV
jgi:hypothetical protein